MAMLLLMYWLACNKDAKMYYLALNEPLIIQVREMLDECGLKGVGTISPCEIKTVKSADLIIVDEIYHVLKHLKL